MPDWLQEFKRGLVDESVPEHRDTSSSSHELPLEPRVKVVPRKHHFYSLPERPKLRSPFQDEKYECFLQTTHRHAVVVQDLATQWIQRHVKEKLLRKHKRVCRSSWSRPGKSKVNYTDKSLEFGKACEELTWNHPTSTPHRSETNGIAERAVRRIKEGTSVVLLQSGLDEKWWADSLECYSNLRNIQDLLSDGKTPYERRFAMPIDGPVIPFGAMVEYHATASFRSKSLAKYIFLGYALHAGVNLERRHDGRRH